MKGESNISRLVLVVRVIDEFKLKLSGTAKNELRLHEFKQFLLECPDRNLKDDQSTIAKTYGIIFTHSIISDIRVSFSRGLFLGCPR